jgi:hypothetical protein
MNGGLVPAVWRRQIGCFRCEQAAVTLTIDPHAPGRGLLLTLDGFLVRKASYLSEPAADGIEGAESWEELLRWLPVTFRGFFCRACDAAYCRACWQAQAPEYEDGEYLGRLGICPGGHQQPIDES